MDRLRLVGVSVNTEDRQCSSMETRMKQEYEKDGGTDHHVLFSSNLEHLLGYAQYISGLGLHVVSLLLCECLKKSSIHWDSLLNTKVLTHTNWPS